MRKLFRRFLFYFFIAIILFDIYILYQVLVETEYSNNNFNQENKENFKQKNDNEFLVLDWTGNQHIFKEQDPIKCKFIFS
jgi:hypothetical protein